MSTRYKLRLLCLCQALLTGGMALSFPFFALYLHRRVGMPVVWVGAWLSFVLLTTAVSQGAGGELSDLYGRRPVMLGSLLARGAGALVLAAAIGRGWPLRALLLSHLAAVFVANFFDPAARGWVADHCDEAERPAAYSLLRVAVNFGWAVGPALGGFLAETDYHRLFLWSALSCALSAAGILLWIPDRGGVRRGEAFEFRSLFDAGKDPRLMRLCVFCLLISIAMSQLVISLSIYAAEFLRVSEGRIGLLFSLNGVMVVLFQYALTLWWGRLRLASALAAGSFLYAVGYAWVGFAGGFMALAGAVAVITVGEMIVSPALHAAAANMAPEDQRGRYLGFLGLMHQLGSGLAPLAGGLGLQYVSARWKPGHWELVAGVAVIAAAGFYGLDDEPIVCATEAET